MARIASLAVLLSSTGNDFLKETYGKVIENVYTDSDGLTYNSFEAPEDFNEPFL